MAQEIINIGSSPNDGSGDPLRVAFQKINNNFSQLYSSGFLTYQTTTFDDSPNQVIFEVPANLFTQGTFQINSANPLTNDSQNITINASIQNDSTSVSWNGHNTIFVNSYVVSGYDMIVEPISGNVQLLVSPSVDATINHLISAQVEVANFTLGIPIGLEGFSGEVLGTENLYAITTETP
jgi:hypothetical protein